MVKDKIFVTLNDRNYFLQNYLKDNLPSSFYRIAFNRKIRHAGYINDYELSSEYKTAILDFWEPYEKINLSWHRAFSAISGIEDPRYIPEDVFYKKIEPALNRYDLRAPYVDKNMTDQLFSEFKMPTTVLRNMNGSFYDTDYKFVTREKAINHVRNFATEHKFIIKPSFDSGAGKNVKMIDFRGYSPKLIEHSLHQLFEDYEQDFIVQEYLYQHAAFQKLHEESLNTLRIVTLRVEDEIKVLSRVIRMGNEGSHTDNAESGCITWGIDREGELLPYATNHWNYEIYEEHPYSKFVFKDSTLPGLEESNALVKKAHQKLLYFDLVSWDIAIDRLGEPNLIEIGVKVQDINYHQRTNGPLFGEWTKKVLNRVYHLEQEASEYSIEGQNK